MGASEDVETQASNTGVERHGRFQRMEERRIEEKPHAREKDTEDAGDPFRRNRAGVLTMNVDSFLDWADKKLERIIQRMGFEDIYRQRLEIAVRKHQIKAEMKQIRQAKCWPNPRERTILRRQVTVLLLIFMLLYLGSKLT